MFSRLFLIAIFLGFSTENEILQNTYGLHQINLLNNKDGILAIQANFSKQQVSILMICDTTPNFTSLSEIYLDQNFQCICDWNAFEFTNTSQQLMVIKDSQLNFNSYPTNTKFTNSQSIFVGIFSKFDDILTLSITPKFQSDCLSSCKNEGWCVQNSCKCFDGYFGFDCEYQGFDILQQDYLEKDKFYFLDVMQIENSSFSLQLQTRGWVSYQCFLENPYLRKVQVQELDILIISTQEIMRCQMGEQQTSEISHYIIVQSYQNELLYIQKQSSNQQEHLKTIIISVVSTGVLFLCCILVCILKCYRLRPKKNPLPNNINIIASLSQNQKIFENSFDWTNLIPAIEYQILIRKHPQIQDQIECQICLDSFNQEQFVRITYCMHVYHYKCFDIWMKQNLICPICRSPQDKKAINKIQNQDNLMNVASSYSQSIRIIPKIYLQVKQQQSNNRYGEVPILTNNRTGGSSKLIQSN